MFGKVGVGPESIGVAPAVAPALLSLQQNRSQPPPNEAVQFRERPFRAVFEVLKPATQCTVDVANDRVETLPVSARGFVSDRVFDLRQALPAHQLVLSPEPIP